MSTTFDQLSDGELLERVAAHDNEAFAALYERHVAALHDFVSRLTRDREMAADVVQNSFIKAWEALISRGVTIANPRSWLFAVARNTALDELRRRSRVVPDPEIGATTVDTTRLANPVGAAEANELAALVWESAAALNPADYALLDLHLRQGLSADELADALGLAKGAVYTRLSRLRDSLEDAVATLLLARHGRRDCPDLDRVLSALPDDVPARRLRRTVRAHVKDCDDCQAARRRIASPAALFSALVPVGLAPSERETMWKQISLATSPAPPWQRPGRWLAAALAAAIMLLSAGGIALSLTASRGGVAAADPTDVHSVSHRVGEPSSLTVITMVWTPRRAANAYSTLWTQDRQAEPPAVAELPGRSASATSPVLRSGSWWFILRTRSGQNHWTDTVRVGPFVIVTQATTESTTTSSPSTTTTTVASTTQVSVPAPPFPTTTTRPNPPSTSPLTVPPTQPPTTVPPTQPPTTQSPPHTQPPPPH